VASLKRQIKLHTSTIISSETTAALLEAPRRPASLGRKLRALSASKQAHDQRAIYRIGSPVTTFRAQDPDPNAVDGGAVLGLRIEVVSRARFLRPYYVFLNRPYAGSRALRVHRHTLPPSVPVGALAARHLPAPGGEGAAPPQDLLRFVRALRRDVVRFHHRLSCVEDMRRAVGLRKGADPAAQGAVLDVAATDVEARQVKIDWADGRVGRLVIADDGRVEKMVVFGERGRDRGTVRELCAAGQRIGDIARKLGDV